jgi:hypothetical protein
MLIVRKREISSGRTVLGPRKIGGIYARIVSLSDGSGRIEMFDGDSDTWVVTEAISFSDIWNAPVVSPLVIEQIAGKPRQK